MSKLELYLSKIVKYGLYAILLTPLAFWPKALYPFLTPKFILFQILVEIVFAAWLALLVLRNTNTRMNTNNTNQNSRHSYDNSYHSYWRKWLITSLFIFIGISFLSAIFGIDFQRSFWGIGARLTGLFAELHFIAWFLVLISYLKNDKEKWNNYLNFSFFVSIAVALTAFYQNPNWSLAIGSTIFNNPTFVTPYFIFHFFWGLYQSISQSKNRWLWASASAFLFVAIILTQIRSSILGFLVGIFIFGIILIFSSALGHRVKIATAVSYLVLIIGIIVFWNIRDFPAVKNISFLNKISQTSLTGATVQTRLLNWQEAIAGFKDRPLLGVGPENYNFVFNAHYNPEFARFADDFAETWSDKPHNAFLEILAETGIIGGLAYLLILAAAASALRALWRKGEKILVGALLGGFLGYLGSIFFAFDSFGSWFGLYLMLGFLASHSNPNLQIHPNTTNINKNLKNLLVAFVLICILGLLYVNYSIWRANLYDAEAIRIFQQKPREGLTLFQKSLSYNTPYKAEYRFDLAGSVMTAVQRNASIPDLENTLNFALEEIDQAIAAHPENAAYYSDAAKLYNILGDKGADPAVLDQAESFAKKSLELSPDRQETLFYLAQTALIRKDVESAIRWTRRAIDAYPEWRKGYWFLGRIYFIAGQYEKSAAEIKKAIDMGYNPQNKGEEEFIKNLGL